MSAKENEVIFKKQILIYLIICFSLTWIYEFTVIRNISSVDNKLIKQVLSVLGMYFPLFAHLCTRIITKEGFKISGEGSLMLTINHKKIVWIFVAMLLPYLYEELGNALLVILNPKLLLSSGMCRIFGITAGKVVITTGKKLILGILFCFVAIGEESGWRGYMMPKLMKLFGNCKAVMIGGTIWGLWHIPLICMGSNFGTDYPGFPFSGILIMTVNCLCVGGILTFLTIKSKSIWPATMMHAINNSTPGIISQLMNTYELGKMNTLVIASIRMIPIFIMGVICILFMVKRNDVNDIS